MITSDQLKQEIINNLKQSVYPKVVNFVNSVGDKCWNDLAIEFYEQQNFTVEEKQDIFNRLLAMNNEQVKKVLVIFVQKEDESVLNQILVNADSNMKKFIARYSSSDNIRQILLNQNPDKALLKEIIAGMINKKLVEQYKDSSDIELKQAYWTRVNKDEFIKRLWR